MADARDLKSRGGNTVWVRLPPPAPEKKLRKAVFLIKVYRESNTQGSPGHLKNHQIFWVGLPPPAQEKKLRFCLGSLPVSHPAVALVFSPSRVP